MKVTEQIFSTKAKSDQKCKLNRFDKQVSKDILTQIESGVTLEQLDVISNAGIPIFRYGTQITIHGLFDDLSNNYIFGYKNIFQNKNKSIGVKYNAIDEDKRRVISERLKVLGFYYRRNSQETKFQFCKSITEETFISVKTEMTSLFKKIDNDLYFGGSYFYAASDGFRKFLVIDIYINAIYQKNIETFLNELGATKELLEAKKEADKIEDKRRENKWKQEQAEREQKRKQALENSTNDLCILEQYEKVTKHTEPGFYILRTFDYKNELVFKAVYIYSLKGKKKPRYNKREYQTLNEALNHKQESHFSDSIFNGRVSGFKIK